MISKKISFLESASMVLQTLQIYMKIKEGGWHFSKFLDQLTWNDPPISNNFLSVGSDTNKRKCWLFAC